MDYNAGRKRRTFHPQRIGIFLEVPLSKCIECNQYVEEYSENALEIIETGNKRIATGNKRIATYDSQKCLGTSCSRCFIICPESATDMEMLKIKT